MIPKVTYHAVRVAVHQKVYRRQRESIPSSVWSDFETILLSVVSDAAKSASGEISTIVKLYNDTVYYSTALFCQKPLPHDIVFRKKSDIQIQAKLQFMRK